MRKGALGVENLNQILQKYLNPPAPDKAERENGGNILREGDKVMQIRNNYQMEWEIRGINGIVAEDTLVNVYDLNGILVRENVKLGQALEGLSKGIYIVNGTKKAVK